MAARNNLWGFMFSVVMIYKIIINEAGGLKVGVVVDNKIRIGKEQKIGIEIAVEDINKNTSNDEVELITLHFKSSNFNNPLQAAYSAIELIKEKKVDIIIGANRWQEATLLGEIGNKHKVPILSLATPPIDPLMTTKDQWPFLVNMNPNYTSEIECIGSLINVHGWRKVVVIYEDDGYDISGTSSLLDLVAQTLQSYGSEIEYHLALPSLPSMLNPEEVISQQLDKLQVLGIQSRVFVVLHSSLPVAIHLFREANNKGLVGRDTSWITTNSISSFFDSMNPSIISSMEGILGVKSYYNGKSYEFMDFSNKFLFKFLQEIQHVQEASTLHPSIHALRAYDAIKTIMKALERAQGKGNFSNIFMEGISFVQFTGLSGEISFENGDLKEGDELLNVVNVVGKKYRELDFWSSNRGFFKNFADQLEVNVSHGKFNGTVIWPGDVKHVPKGWAMPTNAKPLKIGVPGRTSFDKFVKVENGGNPNRTTYSGFCIDVFLEVVKILEESYAFPYEFEAFNGTYDELVDCVYNKTYDAVVGDVTILTNRSKLVDFTQPYARSGLSMIVPLKSEDSHKAWMFMKPFSWQMWLTTLATLLYTMFVVWWIERRNNPDFGGAWNDQLSAALWFTFTSLFFAHREKVESNYARITVVAWLFVVFVLTSSYTANLTSMLTVPILKPKIKDISWLKTSNARIGCDGDSFVYEHLKSVLQINNIANVSNEYAYPDFFSNGTIVAAFIEHPYAKVFLRQYCKSYTQVKEYSRFGGLGFVFQKGSPLVPDVSKAILKLSENGILKQLNDKWFYPSSECLSPSSKADNMNERLGIEVFWILYLFSGIISTMCFILFATQWLKNVRRTRRERSFLTSWLFYFQGYNVNNQGEISTPERPLSLPRLPSANDGMFRWNDATVIQEHELIPLPYQAEMEISSRINRRTSSI